MHADHSRGGERDSQERRDRHAPLDVNRALDLRLRAGRRRGATSFQTFTLNAIWTGAEEEIQIARRAASMATGQAGGRQDDVVASVMGLTKIEGLGDEAYFARRTMSYVRKGDMLLEFENAGLDEPARENWEALARVALGRL